MKVEIIGLEGLPEVQEGDDLGVLIERALRQGPDALAEGDILVVSQKVVSKAEGRLISSESVHPSDRAIELAEGNEKTPDHLEVILQHSRRIVRMDQSRGLFIMETPHGFVCANAGVDRSNAGPGTVYAVLPEDPDASARRIRSHLETAFGVPVAVLISDSFGRPWRRGYTDVALGVSGMAPLRDYRGTRDPFGYELRASLVALADEITAAAELVKGKVSGIPVALVRGVPVTRQPGSVEPLLRDEAEDLFR